MDKRSPHSAHQRREINKALRSVGERIRAKIGRIDIWEAVAVDVVKDKSHFLKVSYGVVVGNAVRNGVKAVAIQGDIRVLVPLLGSSGPLKLMYTSNKPSSETVMLDQWKWPNQMTSSKSRTRFLSRMTICP